MNGALAQAMALVSHGTVWLQRGENTHPRRFDAANSTFQYVRRVSFTRADMVGPRSLVAGDVQGWFDAFHADGVDRLWLLTNLHQPSTPLPAHVAAAFAGGEQWTLLATGTTPTIWRGTWAVGDADAADHRIWDVTFIGVADAAISPPTLSTTSAERELTHALRAIRDFASEHDLSDWADWFSRALHFATADDPDLPYHRDLLPVDGYGNASRRLAAMASQAWVFGGMGSWNDLGFDTPADTERYHRLTRHLYATVLDAAAAAVNAALVGSAE